MDTTTARQYLERVSQEISRVMPQLLEIAPPEKPARVIVRPLLAMAGFCTRDSERGLWRIYVAKEAEGKAELTESELAKSEITLCHESMHILHTESNPNFRREFLKEKEKVNQFTSHHETPRYKLLHCFGEIVAEYISLYFIDRQQGLNVFLARRNKRINPECAIDRVLNAYQNTPQGAHLDICRRLILSNLEQAMEMPVIGPLFLPEIRLIAEHPEIYQPPYQLSLPGMKFSP